MAAIKPATRKSLDPMARTATATPRSPAKRTGVKPPSSMMHVRIEDALRRDAATTLEQIGLSVPEAIRLFLRRVVIEQALPLRLEVPTEKAIRAMEQADASDLRCFASAQELFDDLEKGGVS